MATLSTYLHFNGNTEEAFIFYKSVFGGEFRMLQRMKDAPGGDKLSEKEQQKIMHVAFPIGANIIMASDVSESMAPAIFGTNSSISVDAASEEEATQLFAGLAAGGRVTMPLQKTFWGALFGMLTDKFGVHWMLNYDYNGHS